MIIHLPEAMVPFENAGIERHPLLPQCGQRVMVGCKLEGNHAQPSLVLKTGEQEKIIPGKPCDKVGFYQFDLGLFKTPQLVSYQISAGEEVTPWYRFDVLTVSRYKQSQAIYKTAKGFCLALDKDLSLEIDTFCNVSLHQRPAEGKQIQSAELRLPDEHKLYAGSNFLWRLNRLSEKKIQALAYEVYRDSTGRIVQTKLELSIPAKHILGCGERFDTVDMQGSTSNGRVVEKFTQQGGMSYIPVPFFMTDTGLGWYREGGISTEMRFEEPVTLTQRTESTLLSQDRLLFGAPSEVLRAYLNLTGRPVLPPEWAFGVWISGNGWKDDAEVNTQLKALRDYDYPASVMVLEQWSDEQTFYRWHEEHFPNPKQTVKAIRDAGLRLLLWQIPVLKHDDEHPHAAVHDADIAEAIQKGFVIRRADGSPYRINDRWFVKSLLPDFTNPEACAWWFEKRKYLLEMGVEGFKTDGGEFLFEEDARLHNGMSGLEAHNLYPGQYIAAYWDFLRDNGVKGLTFSRAGYAGAQAQPAHWAGDQVSTFSELQAQLKAGISAGLSGILFWGFDIGGFAGPIPDAELYLRATALACFSPIMQWHAEPRGGQYGGMKEENNDRSPWNLAERLNDPQVLSLGVQYAKLRESLRPYLWQEARYCVKEGRPLMAHLCLDFPEDQNAWQVDDQFMLGRELLVAPIVEAGKTSRPVYLPRGTWRNYFTKEQLSGEQTIRVTALLDTIPVFKKVEQ